jgi:hypothetical protein
MRRVMGGVFVGTLTGYISQGISGLQFVLDRVF